jgi:hypothetical protein
MDAGILEKTGIFRLASIIIATASMHFFASLPLSWPVSNLPGGGEEQSEKKFRPASAVTARASDFRPSYFEH